MIFSSSSLPNTSMKFRRSTGHKHRHYIFSQVRNIFPIQAAWVAYQDESIGGRRHFLYFAKHRIRILNVKHECKSHFSLPFHSGGLEQPTGWVLAGPDELSPDCLF